MLQLLPTLLVLLILPFPSHGNSPATIRPPEANSRLFLADHGGEGGDDSEAEGYCEINSYANFEQCGTTGFNSLSFCYLDVGSVYQCVANAPCSVINANPCASNSDCHQDWVCVSACSVIGCIPLCSNSNDPFGAYFDDFPPDDDGNHDNDVCFPPDYIADNLISPTIATTTDSEPETVLSSLLTSLPSDTLVTSSSTSSSSLTSSNLSLSSVLSPLNVAFSLLVTLSAVGVLTLVRLVSSPPPSQRSFSQLSFSEHRGGVMELER
jgi:hypothetical protein